MRTQAELGFHMISTMDGYTLHQHHESAVTIMMSEADEIMGSR